MHSAFLSERVIWHCCANVNSFTDSSPCVCHHTTQLKQCLRPSNISTLHIYKPCSVNPHHTSLGPRFKPQTLMKHLEKHQDLCNSGFCQSPGHSQPKCVSYAEFTFNLVTDLSMSCVYLCTLLYACLQI